MTVRAYGASAWSQTPFSGMSPAGGSGLRTVSDSITLVESLTRTGTRPRAITGTLTFSDAILSVAHARSITDSITFVELLTRQPFARTRLISASITLSEFFSAGPPPPATHPALGGIFNNVRSGGLILVAHRGGGIVNMKRGGRVLMPVSGGVVE